MFGSMPYGGVPFGSLRGGALEPPTLDFVYAAAQNRLVLRFSTALREDDPVDLADALNPRYYGVEENGEKTLEVVEARLCEREDEVELWLVPSMSEGADIDVSVAAGISTGSGQMVGEQSASIVAPVRMRDRARGPKQIDFASPQPTAERSPGAMAPDIGTYQTSGTGDYAVESRRANLRKRIYRQLIVSPGSLPSSPDYGIGIERHRAQAVTDALKQTIAGDIRRGLLREPDIAQVRVKFEEQRTRQGLVLVVRIGVTATDGFADESEHAFDWEVLR
ncbi:MAG: hypothetical protein C4523_17755 [Myxococcales bacterium]|nr:MAG: hypothetical protein C4523_17755 [Myxococcales bacterium]